MTNSSDLYVQTLVDLFSSKKQINPNYSMRALSRDIGISQSQLSRLIQGQRKATPKEAYKIGLFLKLKAEALIEFMKPSLSYK